MTRGFLRGQPAEQNLMFPPYPCKFPAPCSQRFNPVPPAAISKYRSKSDIKVMVQSGILTTPSAIAERAVEC
jgi:hypothetical protein